MDFAIFEYRESLIMDCGVTMKELRKCSDKFKQWRSESREEDESASDFTGIVVNLL